MKFVITSNIFEQVPNMYVGVVVAHGINNSIDYPIIDEMLNKYMQAAQEKFADTNVKQRPEIIPYREAFRKIGINPNRFPCSAEALFKRLSKGKDLPHINPLVDLNNAISLKYTVPMGTHTLDNVTEDIMMRTAKAGDQFVPLGKDTVETPDDGEVVYAVGNEVRTRRWTWRQSKYGKITPDTKDVFFPIDGFVDINKEAVDQAKEDLANQLHEIFGVETLSGIVDRTHPSFEWN
ncbi:B3 4 domain-containing protein [Limosilactobacillus coleohominis DSM 14060]|nr:B3 4 domain-containing protein [Limosilactobacillus coleohominis DSM 14060]